MAATVEAEPMAAMGPIRTTAAMGPIVAIHLIVLTVAMVLTILIMLIILVMIVMVIKKTTLIIAMTPILKMNSIIKMMVRGFGLIEMVLRITATNLTFKKIIIRTKIMLAINLLEEFSILNLNLTMLIFFFNRSLNAKIFGICSKTQ
jgi:hypothetical protein